MTEELHAEIAGGGIAGLALGTMLRMRGWSVRVHERNEHIREVGAGIYLRPNPMRVLDVLGVGEELRRHGMRLERATYRDGVTGAYTQRHRSRVDHEMWICPRQTLIQELERNARESGVEIELGSEVQGADPDGILRTSKGEFRGDLVVGADGIASPVRESLGLTKERKRLPTLATRYLPPTREIEPEPQTTMYWSGSRRIGIAACSEDSCYIYMICPEEDEKGASIPMDVESWSESFPILAPVLEKIQHLPAIQHNYAIVRCHSWHKGRVAIIGDAAHGLPPLLGQGAGLALSNANAVATMVGSSRDTIPADLAAWESSYRHYADRTQFWSMHLDAITNHWPRQLLSLRKPYLRALGKSSRMQHLMRVADTFPIKQPV